MSNHKVIIVGAGLAGSEAALVLSRLDKTLDIELYEMRPKKTTPVHKTGFAAELVCSNSFKSMKKNSAAGMLKFELAALSSPTLAIALDNSVSAGQALAVDREKFAFQVTEELKNSQNIKIVREEFCDISKHSKNCDALILAAGPLTSKILADELITLTGCDNLSFYDAAAPIVMEESINKNIVFKQDRYNDESSGDYLNAPFQKIEYERFMNELLNAECIIKKDFESKDLFQACQPIEEVARTGIDAPRFGALKPVGLTDPRTGKRPYAVVQLRSENKDCTSYNLVGFQTNLKFAEQKRVFRMIPGLENAEFARYGVMHRNTFVDSPKILDWNLCLKNTNIYIAGQLSGTEGYTEAIRSGYHAAISVISKLKKTNNPTLSRKSIFGSLISYSTSSDTKNYQPMHVNFGIIEPLEEKIRNKQQRYLKYANRGKTAIQDYISELIDLDILNKEILFDSKKLLKYLGYEE